jgi:hypothetical protein
VSGSTKILRHICAGLFGTFMFAFAAHAQATPPSIPEKIIIDTDIGDDVDDAFAIALALRSPELQILGISTTFGDTEARAKIVDRLLAEAGRQDIPVTVGAPTHTSNVMTQRRYGEAARLAIPAKAKAPHPNAADFILDQIRRYPGEITLIAIGPLFNVGALIDKDPESFPQAQAGGPDGRIGRTRLRRCGVRTAARARSRMEHQVRRSFRPETLRLLRCADFT